MIREKQAREKEFVEKFGHIRIPKITEAYGRSFLSIGGQIHHPTSPVPYTFSSFLHGHALLFFGEEFLKTEERKELNERHPALQWLSEYVRQSQLDEEVQTGAGAAWWRLAYDLYTIRDNSDIQAKMKERLLDVSTFQGARHELWVAALFITANFEIEYENEDDNKKKHAEFIAFDRESPAKIAVEAKSRHRKGVKGFTSGVDRPAGEDVGVRGLVLDAYKKVDEIPLYVMIDVNLPPQTLEGDKNKWLLEIATLMSDLGLEGYAAPCPANAIFFHNDPSHFMLNKQIGGKLDTLWIKDFVPLDAKIPDSRTSIIRDRIMKAYNQRVQAPYNLPDL